MGYVYHTSPYFFDTLEPRSKMYNGEAGLDHIKFSCATDLTGAKIVFGLNIRGNCSLTNGGPIEMATLYGDFEYLIRKAPSYIYCLKDNHFFPYFNKAAHEYAVCTAEPIEYYIEFYPEDFIVSIWHEEDATKILYNAKKIELEIRPILLCLNRANDICENFNVSKNDKQLFFEIARMCIKNYNEYHFTSNNHDIHHSLMIMGTTLALAYLLNKKEYIRELLFSAAFHDCGKSLNIDYENHGAYSFLLSARFAEELGFNLELIQKLMTFHDKEDVAKQDELISIVRDADIVDLPRVGITIDPTKMSHYDLLKEHNLI